MKVKAVIFIVFLLSTVTLCRAQGTASYTIGGWPLTFCVYEGDTIPCIEMPNIYVFKPLAFKSKKEWVEYYRLIYNIKKVLPIAREINRAIIETYEYMQTLPTEKERKEHIKRVEKGLKQQYTPQMKKLSFTQGKLLIKLVDRENNQTTYQLVKAFMGPFKATFYQAFAALFGASLKKEYHPEGEDQLIERIVLMIDNGQL
jgi:hypothetical protein